MKRTSKPPSVPTPSPPPRAPAARRPPVPPPPVGNAGVPSFAEPHDSVAPTISQPLPPSLEGMVPPDDPPPRPPQPTLPLTPAVEWEPMPPPAARAPERAVDSARSRSSARVAAGQPPSDRSMEAALRDQILTGLSGEHPAANLPSTPLPAAGPPSMSTGRASAPIPTPPPAQAQAQARALAQSPASAAPVPPPERASASNLTPVGASSSVRARESSRASGSSYSSRGERPTPAPPPVEERTPLIYVVASAFFLAIAVVGFGVWLAFSVISL